jgi:hypothetical protein
MILVDKFDYHGSSINGPSRYFSWILPRIDRKRFQPFLCSLRSAWKSDVLFRQEGVEVEYFGLNKYNPWTLQRIVQFVRRHEINVLHLSGYGATTFGRVAAKLCRRPAIVQEHWVDPGIGRGQRILERFLSPWTDWAIAISDDTKRFLVDKKHVQADRIGTLGDPDAEGRRPTSLRVRLGELRDLIECRQRRPNPHMIAGQVFHRIAPREGSAGGEDLSVPRCFILPLDGLWLAPLQPFYDVARVRGPVRAMPQEVMRRPPGNDTLDLSSVGRNGGEGVHEIAVGIVFELQEFVTVHVQPPYQAASRT